jgi:outer membrane protein assembly factor BamD
MHRRLEIRLSLTVPLVALGLVALTLPACKGTMKQDPLLALSAAESLTKGKDLISAEKYTRARPYFVHAFEVEPNSATGRESLLLAADTYYLEGGRTNYVQAEAKYRDFLNRFPTSDRAAYAQFQVASSLAKRMERADRDQASTRQALSAFEDLLRQYPTSEYAAQAREQIRLVRDNLAEHELEVAEFYVRYGIPEAAVFRLTEALEIYPDFSGKDRVLFHLGDAYVRNRQPTEARAAYERLRQQFPESPLLDKVPQEIPDVPAPKAEKAAEKAGGPEAPPPGGKP